MARQMSKAMKRSSLRFALAMPLFFMIMFPLCYISALHLPDPHEIPVAVAGEDAAAFIDGAGPALDGNVELIAADSPQTAEDMLIEQQVKAAYLADSGSPQLLIAGANGRLAEQLIPTFFEPLAEQAGTTLEVTDVAPLAPGDGNGIGLMFFMLVCVLLGFMSANIIGNAAFFLRLWQRLCLSFVINLAAPIVLYLFMGPWLEMIVGTTGQALAIIAIGFVASFTTSLLTHAAVVFWGKWALFPSMLVFVFLNIPSSNSVYPAEMVPGVFGWISNWHLGAATVSSIRSVLYLDGAGLARPLLTMAVWLLLAVAAIGAAAVHRRRAARAEVTEQRKADEQARQEADAAGLGAGPEQPALQGQVSDHAGLPLSGAEVVVFDPSGNETARVQADGDGWFHVAGLPEGNYGATVYAGARGEE